MGFLDSMAAVLLAGIGLYGLGMPLAWLLPAPMHSQWIARIAVAPLPAILVATVVAWLLGQLGVPLRWYQLALVAGAAWVLAGIRAREQWDLRGSLRDSVLPALLIAMGSLVWAASLNGYGLYLPNRDFKNHAYLVAQVAGSQSSDMSLILRPAPITGPVEGLYPAGLHTLLGWVLPSPDYNTLGVTAAAAIVVVIVSLPLALVALGRMVDAQDTVLWMAAGAMAILLPGLTGTFRIGSVVLLAGMALYAAALIALWQWVRTPGAWGAVAVVVVALGLLVLHVAEAVALGLVAALAIALSGRNGPIARMSRRERLAALTGGVVIVVGGLAMALSLGLTRLLDRPVESWDVESNTFGVFSSILASILTLGSGNALHAVLLVVCVVGGAAILLREKRLDGLLASMIVVPLVLAVVASVTWIPDELRAVTAPWYGAIGRIALLLGPPVALLAAAALGRFITVSWAVGRGQRASWVPRVVVLVACLGALGWTAATEVGSRRGDLEATLAGAGDTPALAAELTAALVPGETVLNFEDDGTANLYAAARIPVTVGLGVPSAAQTEGVSIEWLMRNLLDLSSPKVASAMDRLRVRYVALGTTSLYWASDKPGSGIGYSLEELLGQPELSVWAEGSELVLLRYQP